MNVDRHTRGVFAIAPTPFDEDGSIDTYSLDSLIDYYEGSGVDGLTILGQLGEAAKLTQAEAVAVAQRFLSRSRLPIVVGVSSPGFAAMSELTAAVMDHGAQGVMIGPPASLRTDEQIVGYYAAAAEAVGASTPFVLQDYPLTFSVQMSPGVIGRIARDNENCVMLKHEDWPGLEKISALRELERAAGQPRLSILCGNGGTFLDFETERGADGAMTGYCFPEMLVDVVSLAATGRRDEAHDVFDRHLPLARYEQQPGIGLGVRKHVFVRRGIIRSDRQRRPHAPVSAVTKAETDYLLERLARVDDRAAVTPSTHQGPSR